MWLHNPPCINTLIIMHMHNSVTNLLHLISQPVDARPKRVAPRPRRPCRGAKPLWTCLATSQFPIDPPFSFALSFVLRNASPQVIRLVFPSCLLVSPISTSSSCAFDLGIRNQSVVIIVAPALPKATQHGRDLGQRADARAAVCTLETARFAAKHDGGTAICWR